MKDVVILQNHPASFKLDIAKLSCPERYALNLITNPVGHEHLASRGQLHLFERIFVDDPLSLAVATARIEAIRSTRGRALDIVTNSEHAISLCGKLRVQYGLQSEDNERFINKLIMKERLVNAGVLIPRHIAFDKRRYSRTYLEEIMRTLSFPMFVKPIDQAGSIGTAKLTTATDLFGWAAEALASPYEYEIDEFIDGILYHCDSLIKDGTILFTQVSQYSRPSFDFVRGFPRGSITLPRESPDSQALRAFAARALGGLRMPDNGVTHMEVFKNAGGDFVFLEIACRSPGTLIPKMYERHLGIDIAATNIRLQIDPDFHPQINRGPYVAYVTYPNGAGRITAIHEPPATRSECDYTQLARIGEVLKRSEVVRDFRAYALLWSYDFAALREDVTTLSEFRPYTFLEDSRSVS